MQESPQEMSQIPSKRYYVLYPVGGESKRLLHEKDHFIKSLTSNQSASSLCKIYYLPLLNTHLIRANLDFLFVFTSQLQANLLDNTNVMLNNMV